MDTPRLCCTHSCCPYQDPSCLDGDHCGDPDCTTAVVGTVQSAGTVGQYGSLMLDAAGNPVISYHENTTGSLKLAILID